MDEPEIRIRLTNIDFWRFSAHDRAGNPVPVPPTKVWLDGKLVLVVLNPSEEAVVFGGALSGVGLMGDE